MDENSTSDPAVPGDEVFSKEETTWSRVLVGVTMLPIIVLGTVGNILSLLVWLKICRCRTSTACFLAALAVADLLSIFIGGVNFWISEVTLTDPRSINRATCKFMVYMDFTCQFISAWLIALITSERAVCLWFPHAFRKVCKPMQAGGIVFIVTVIMFLLCTPFLVGSDIVSVPYTEVSPVRKCIFVDTPAFKLVEDEGTWYYLEGLVHFILPFVIIIVSNISITIKVLGVANSQRRWYQGLRERLRRTAQGKKLLTTVTLRTIVLSVAFCFGVGPIHLCGYKETLQDKKIINNVTHIGGKMDKPPPEYICFVILMYVNNAVNFLLYCLIGSSFRRDLRKLFPRGTFRCCLVRPQEPQDQICEDRTMALTLAP